MLPFIGSDLFDFDLLTIITAYLFSLYGQTGAGAFAFGQGLFIDLFSGGLHGLFTFLYLCIFGGIYLGSRFFDLQDPKGQAVLIFLAILLKKIMFFMLLTVFSQETNFPRSFLWISGASAIGSGLVAPLFFYFFNRLRDIAFENERNAST